MAHLNADPQTVRDILEQEQDIHNKVEFGIIYFENSAADRFVCDELASWAVDLKDRFNQKRICKFYQAYLGRGDANLVVCSKVIAFIQKDSRLYESYKAKICVAYLSRLTADARTIRKLIDEGVSTSWEASYQYQVYKAYFFSKHVDPAVTREKFEWIENFGQPDLNFYLAYLMAENAYVQHKDEMYIQAQNWAKEPERIKVLWQDPDQVKCLEYKIRRITKRCGADAVKLMNIVKIKQMELDSSITEASVRKLDGDLQLLKEALAYKKASE